MSRRGRLILLGVAGAIALAIGLSLPAVVLTLRRASTPTPDSAEDPVAAVARQYITAKEGWPASDYTVENTQRRDSDGNLIVNVIHQDDLKSLAPGGGKSLELHINPEKRQVVEALHFQ